MGKKKGRSKTKLKLDESPGTSPDELSAVAMQEYNQIMAAPVAKPDVMVSILKVLQEPSETMYRGLSQRAQHELSPQEVRELRELFSIFNIGGSGYLSYAVLCKSLRTMGFTVGDKELKGALADCNVNIEEGITFTQFVDIVLIEQGNSIDVYEELMSGFSAMDIKRKGKITAGSLRKLAAQLGEDLSQTEIEDMIAEADKSGNGEVSPKEFIEVMLKTNLFRGTNVASYRNTAESITPTF